VQLLNQKSCDLVVDERMRFLMNMMRYDFLGFTILNSTHTVRTRQKRQCRDNTEEDCTIRNLPRSRHPIRILDSVLVSLRRSAFPPLAVYATRNRAAYSSPLLPVLSTASTMGCRVRLVIRHWFRTWQGWGIVLHTSPGLATMDSVDSSFSPASFTSFSRVGSRVDSFGLESLAVTI
jgi:hypothetical protein